MRNSTYDFFYLEAHPLLSALSNGLCYGAVALATVLVYTYASSWYESFPATRHTGHEPPIVPYVIPYFGHVFALLSNPGDMVRRFSKRYPHMPFSILLPGAKFHVVTSPETAFQVFKKPRDFIAEPIVASMMNNALQFDGPDLAKFSVPLTPHRKSPNLSAVDREALIFTGRNHNILLKNLSGKALDPILQIYKHHLLKAVTGGGFPIDEEAQPVQLNMHKTLRKLIFDASAVTFFGTRALDLAPDLWEYWRSFDDAAYIGVRMSLGFTLRPWTLSPRRKMLEAFDKWVDTDVEEEWMPEEGGVWMRKWGVKMNWEREHMCREHEMTLRGRACVHVSFLWVVITNTAPMLTWTMNAILTHPKVLTEFRQVVQQFMTPGGVEGFRVGEFSTHPFIQATWKEILRLGVTSAAARVVSQDSEIDGYVVKRGSLLMIPTRVLHFDPDVFADPDSFNPWRWIQEGNPSLTAEKLKQQNDSLRPFGGGTGVCSGRFIAEQEVLLAAAVLLHLFDWEFDTRQWLPSPNLNPRGLGGMHPLVDPRITVSRRTYSKA